jgi:hypothetical protein
MDALHALRLSERWNLRLGLGLDSQCTSATLSQTLPNISPVGAGLNLTF